MITSITQIDFQPLRIVSLESGWIIPQPHHEAVEAISKQRQTRYKANHDASHHNVAGVCTSPPNNGATYGGDNGEHGGSNAKDCQASQIRRQRECQYQPDAKQESGPDRCHYVLESGAVYRHVSSPDSFSDRFGTIEDVEPWIDSPSHVWVCGDQILLYVDEKQKCRNGGLDCETKPSYFIIPVICLRRCFFDTKQDTVK
jgi:hypothetical protein